MNITDHYKQLVENHSHFNARGFVNINCPACGDRRRRGGFAITSTGGFRYYCFNGGCEYQHPTGWEPEGYLNKRTRDLFELLGGNSRDLPLVGATVNKSKKTLIDTEVTTRFVEIPMPDSTVFLDEADDKADPVRRYLDNRSPIFMETGFPFMWSIKHPRHLLIPYIHHKNKIVGYLGRNIDQSDGPERFIQRCSKDFLFQQNKILGKEPYLIVVESPLDAILLKGVGTRSNRLTKRQINLLKRTGKQIIMVPDLKKQEAGHYIKAADDNGWLVSIPDWGVKDPGEAVTKYGLLATIDMIMNSKTNNKITINKMLSRIV